jgi:hypothetical protein
MSNVIPAKIKKTGCQLPMECAICGAKRALIAVPILPMPKIPSANPCRSALNQRLT